MDEGRRLRLTTPRYQLRTLLLLLAILPPLLAALWWKYSAWKGERQEFEREVLRAWQDAGLRPPLYADGGRGN